MKRTFLLVDDNRTFREVIKVFLIAEGITLLEAGDGEEALGLIRTKRPDAVVCDLRMPKLDGPGLCRALQGERALRDTPVIILTSNRDPASRLLCLQAGAKDVLTKPVSPANLLASIQQHISPPR